MAQRPSTIEVRVSDHRDNVSPIGETFEIASFIIDGRDLVRRVADCRQRQGSERPDDYQSLSVWWFEGHLADYLGVAPLIPVYESGHVTMLACGSCGDLGCFDVVARITASYRTIEWSDFRPALGGTVGDTGLFAGIGPFTFRRPDYEWALRHPIRRWRRKRNRLPRTEPRR